MLEAENREAVWEPSSGWPRGLRGEIWKSCVALLSCLKYLMRSLD